MGQIISLLDPKSERRLARIQQICLAEHVMPPPAQYWELATYLPPKHLQRAGVDEINRHEVVWEPMLDPEGHPLFTVRGKPRRQIARYPDGSPRRRLVHRFEDEGGELLGGVLTRAHSWVRNPYNLVTTQMCGIASTAGAVYGAGGLYNKDTGGTNRAAANQAHYIAALGIGAVGSTSNGIVAGTGIGAESFEDSALGTLIANGTGADQFSYAAQEATTNVYAALVWTSTMIRYLNNNSGGAITVGEVACYMVCYLSGSGYNEMLARELLAATVEVKNSAQLKVTATFKSPTYPA